MPDDRDKDLAERAAKLTKEVEALKAERAAERARQDAKVKEEQAAPDQKAL